MEPPFGGAACVLGIGIAAPVGGSTHSPDLTTLAHR
jgi:hypothetical protein